MKKILILEPNPEMQKPLTEAIQNLAGQYEALFFLNLAQFNEYLKSILKSDPQANAEEKPAFEIPLVILDEVSGRNLKSDLLERTQKLFISKQFCSPEAPTQFIITTFDSPEFKIKNYLLPIYANVIFKPFDNLVLKEFLKLGIEGRKAVRSELYTHKSGASVELIKEVDITHLTELGFRSVSNQPVETGKIARYYSQLFEGERLDYVFAYCSSCTPDPQDTKKFYCSFGFFGIGPEQLSVIRRKIHKEKHTPVKKAISNNNQQNSMQFLILHRDPQVFETLKTSLLGHFKNINFLYAPTLHKLQEYLPPAERELKPDAEVKPPFPKAESFKFIFDANGEYIIDILAKTGEQAASVKEMFFTDLKTIQSKQYFLKNYLTEDEYKHFIKLLKFPEKAESKMLKFTFKDNNEFLFESPNSLKTKGPDNRERFELVLRPLTEEEIYKINQKSNFNFPQVSGIFIDSTYFEEPHKENLISIIQKLTKSSKDHVNFNFFGLHFKPILDYETVKNLSFLKDYFCTPVDSFYLNRKLKQFFPDLSTLKVDDLSYEEYEIHTTIKTALPVKIESVSEALIIFDYHRKLQTGEIRKFLLSKPGTKNIPEVTSMCNFSEKNSENSFKCYFINFGVRDHQLKHIRQWVLEEYIKNKNK